ncbi:MAG TPA: beta-ketoacyl-ACP synthase II [Opitutales bacterium]|jgi:3-oxoacyl-[acyl-carrier-protein] synthase II|nr:beta-ketoacyl-ACP synthase II [Opitutales bacterium]
MDTASPFPRVVVTGLGAVTSLGHNVPDFWNGLLAGRSGIHRIERFDITDYPCKIGGEVRDWDPATLMDPKEVRRNDRYTHFAVAAALQALADANLKKGDNDPDRMGVIIGSGIGGLETIEKQSKALFDGGPRKVSPFMIPSLISNMAAGVVAISTGAKGPNFGIVSACATGTHALGVSLRAMQFGEADVMIAGGSEAAINRLGFGGFCAARTMSTNFNDQPERASRPFDKMRDGFVMGEGAGVLVLETLEHARKRGARIYCELVGYAATCDAYHITSPDPEGAGLAKALRTALKTAGLGPEDVDYINMHGTSTAYNDKFETMAVKSVLGARAYKIPMSSTKSMTGHLLGAAGGIEAIVCVKAIETGEIPPTINLETPDLPDCDLDYVPNVKRSVKVRTALSSNLGFGGHNAVVAFRAV